MPERELPEAAQSIEECGTKIRAMTKQATRAIEKFAIAMKGTVPQTKEEWEDAYFELYGRHQRLLRAADDVIAVALPTDDDHRKIVSERALEVLWAEVLGG